MNLKAFLKKVLCCSNSQVGPEPILVQPKKVSNAGTFAGSRVTTTPRTTNNLLDHIADVEALIAANQQARRANFGTLSAPANYGHTKSVFVVPKAAPVVLSSQKPEHIYEPVVFDPVAAAAAEAQDSLVQSSLVRSDTFIRKPTPPGDSLKTGPEPELAAIPEESEPEEEIVAENQPSELTTVTQATNGETTETVSASWIKETPIDKQPLTAHDLIGEQDMIRILTPGQTTITMRNYSGSRIPIPVRDNIASRGRLEVSSLVTVRNNAKDLAIVRPLDPSKVTVSHHGLTSTFAPKPAKESNVRPIKVIAGLEIIGSGHGN